MANISFVKLIQRHLGSLVMTGLFIAALGFVALIVTSPRYDVRTDFLVNQNNAETKDYYTLARSSDYIGKVLSEVMYSEKFINAAVETGKVNQTTLPFDKSDRIAEWRKMVKVEREADLGILRVTVLSNDSKEAQMVSQAVAQVLAERNKEFLGTSDQQGVAVSILSGPITDRNPNIGEIITVLLAGFLFGFILATFVLYVKSERSWKKALTLHM